MDKMFNALPGVLCFVDDILVVGKNEREQQDRLIAVLNWIKENGMKIQKISVFSKFPLLSIRV